MRSYKADSKVLKARKYQIDSFVTNVISRYLTEIYRIKTVRNFVNSETFTISDLRIEITRNLEKSRVYVYNGDNTITFYSNVCDQYPDRIFWLLDTYHVSGNEPVIEGINFDITKKFLNDFRIKHGIARTESINVSINGGLVARYGDWEATLTLSEEILNIHQIIQTYPYKNTGTRDLYKLYKKYPIIEYYYATMTFLMIRWFRNSILNVFPKDVARLIAKEIWALRFCES